MIAKLRLVLQILRALFRIGLLSIRPSVPIAFLRAWWRCGSSYACLAEFAAHRFPDQVAVVDENGSLSFRALHAQAENLAADLATRHALRPGYRVALLSRNHRDMVVALIALSRLGVDILVLGTESPAPVLQRLLAGQSPRLVLHDAEFAETLSFCTNSCQILESATAVRTIRLPRLRKAGRILLLTSGSTGAAKNIARRPTLASMLPVVAGLLRDVPLRMHAPAVSAIPLYHGYGLAVVAMALTFGATLHVARRCEIAPLLARLPEGAPPAYLISVPTLLQRWLGTAPARTPSLAAVITGSAPLSPGLCRRLLDRLGPHLFNLYGSTEAGIISLATPAELQEAPGTVGRPLIGNRVQIVSGTNEIQAQGPLVAAPKDQWFGTGDVGHVDEQGRLFVRGRLDGMLVCGGENVYPFETESVLLEHPELADAAVVAVGDPEFGQALFALVVPRPGITIDPITIRDWLRQRVDRCKLPREIKLAAAIPRNALGKVDGPALRGLVACGHRGPH
jgi:acyl-CoA synthetase (AMP-forming)/AMP-acid ligase II